MDPIIVVGPDGVENEFPAGTDDATISAAMAAAYPPPGEGGAPQEQAGPTHQLARDPLKPDRIALDETAGFNPDWPSHATYAKMAEDGEINPNFPEGTDQNPYTIPPGMSDDAIQELIERGVTFIDAEGRVQRKADDLYGLYVGMARPAVNTMNWLENGIDAAGDFVGAEGAGEAFHDWRLQNTFHATQEGMDSLEAQARQVGVRPGRGGQVAGSVVATAPLAAATRNPWLLGAAEGALTSNAQDAAGLARDTAFGAVVGKGGDVAARALGSAIRPNINPATRRLVEEGVEVSPGQLLGGLAHRTEDATTGVPALGDIPNSAQRRAQESVAHVAVQRPLTSIGVELPRNIQSTHDAIDFAQREIGQAYDDLIPQLDLRLDPNFATDFRSLDAAVRNMQDPQVQQWERLIQNEVMPRFNSIPGTANGRITGESFKELESILGKEVRDFSSGLASPHDRRYASAVRELQAQLRDMLARNNPAQAERLQSINDAYRQLSVLEDAAQSAPAGARGRFTPQQLDAAARRADPSVRRRAHARGDSLFQDLSQDAGEVMARTVNDSGTATRGAMTAALGAAFLGQTMNISVNPWALGALTMGALPYNRQGGRIFTSMMTQRPEFAGAARRVVDNNSWLAALTASANNSVDRNEGRLEAQEANANADKRSRWDAVEQRMNAEGAYQ